MSMEIILTFWNRIDTTFPSLCRVHQVPLVLLDPQEIGGHQAVRVLQVEEVDREQRLLNTSASL